MSTLNLPVAHQPSAAPRWSQFNPPNDQLTEEDLQIIGAAYHEVMQHEASIRMQAFMYKTMGYDWRHNFPLLQMIWPSCRGTWDQRDGLLDYLGSIHNERGWEPPIIRALPSRIKVYRGSSRTRVHGLSWTLDQSVAERYACPPELFDGQPPVISSGFIKREDVFAFIPEDGESEVVLDPVFVRQLTVKEWFGGDYWTRPHER